MQPAAFLTFFGLLVTFFEVTITKHFTGFFAGGALTCEGCGKIFTSLNFLQRHMKRYCLTRTTNRTWDCKKCNKRFASMHYLKIHVRIDSKEHPHQNIKRKKKIVNHNRLSNTNTGKKPYQCILCNKVFICCTI